MENAQSHYGGCYFAELLNFGYRTDGKNSIHQASAT